MKKTKLFLINGIILTITAFLMKSIGMIFNLYLSNKIGAEAVGVFTLVMSVYIFAITLSTSGLSLACTRIVSEQLAQNNYENAFKAVKSCLLFSLFLGLGSSFLILFLAKTITTVWLKSTLSPIPLYLIAIGLPLISMASVLNGYFSAVRKGYKSAMTQVFELIIKILVSILFLNLCLEKNVEMICICLILADVISEFCSFVLLYLLYKLEKATYYSRAITSITFKKEILKITLPVSITSYIRSGLSMVKQFLIPNRLVLFGLPYTIALSEYGKINGMTMAILLFPNVFITSFSNLLIPEFSSLMIKQYQKRMKEICQKIFGITFLFSFGIAILFFLFADEISLIIFHNLDCSKYLRFLSPIILFMYPDSIIDSILKGLNKQFEVLICNILDLILTILLLYFLLPHLGINGYLLCILISEIFNFSISSFQLYRAIWYKTNHLK